MIFYHRYELKSAGSLNAKSGRTSFEGSLIRSEDGVGCLHPWPELGDATLDEQLKQAAAGNFTPQFSRALDCCRADGIARRAGVSLFAGKTIPLSHATLPQTPSINELEALAAEGFEAVKIKWLNDFLLKESPLKLRIDFNAALSADQFLRVIHKLPATIKARIDFVEDPCDYDPAVWTKLAQETQLNLALDRTADENPNFIQVWKPALGSQPAPNRAGRIITTSYMDHAVGQMFAAWEAANLASNELCGLLTHKLFEQDAFFQQVRSIGPQLLAPKGTGLGFDDLIERLPWKRL